MMRRGMDVFAYLAAEPDDALIMRAIAQRAENDHGEERKADLEVSAKLIANEVARLMG